MAQRAFEGVLTAVVTPFKASGDIDFEAFELIVKMQRASGLHGIVIGGTTGESPTLSEDERLELGRCALKLRTDDFLIHVNIGTNNTGTSERLAERFSAFRDDSGRGFDGFMAVVPYYNKPSQDGLLAHFSAIAGALGGAPLCVYNVPGRTSCAILPLTVQRLISDVPNVVAIKEATADLRIITEMRRAIDAALATDRVRLLSGDDATFAPSLAAGADGVISVASHIIPAAMLGMQQAALRGDLLVVRDLQLKAYPLMTTLFCASNPTPLKWIMSQIGLCGEHVRLPLTPISEREKVMVRGAWDAVLSSGLRVVTPRDAER